MQHLFRCITVCALVLAVTATTFASSIELRLKDGTRWRGEVGDSVKLTILEQNVPVPFEGKIIEAKDLYLVIEGSVAGKVQKKTVFKSDIQSISSMSEKKGAPATAPQGPAPQATTESTNTDVSATGPAIAAKPGVFVLPMSGMVGVGIREKEIDLIGKEADRYGPGQIIVIIVDTNGGFTDVSELIDESIANIQKRHRVVAWIRKAISAGCSLAMSCQEIYFMTEGTAGSVTTLAGGHSLPEDQQMPGIEHLVEVAKRNGHSEHIARAMKINKFICTYTKDPVTGEVTFYGDRSGAVMLSDENSNLCFNSSNALDCGFSDGTADTEAELAKLLNLPEWYEISDYGRKISKQWQDTVAKAEYEIPLAMRRFEFQGTATGDPVVVLGRRIALVEELIGWWRRCPNVARTQLPPEPDLQRMVEDLRKKLSDIKNSQRK